MKTKIFYILFTVAFSLGSLNTYAIGNKGKKANKQKNITSVATIISTFKEAEMEIESWMVSLHEFNSKSTFTEEEIQMESWMMNEFSVKNTNDFQEDEIVLEDWMLESFDTKTQEIFVEEELELESWMFSIL